MAITKRIIELMGGSIDVITAAGEGTEFIVNVTLKVAAKPEQEQSSEAKEIDFTGKRLLLVDDMEINREIALAILESSGFEVEEACDGKEAVEKIENADVGYFDAVLMDIQMPVMNGYDAARAIRSLSNDKLSAIPIIAMTANAFEEDKKAAREAGMNGHVAKPIDVEELMSTLGNVLDG